MISRFFIDHPIFATVIAVVIAFAGFVAMRNLPIEQFPNMIPPDVQITAVYNGANAETVANDVASPLGQQILGVQDMIYMYSQSSSTGKMTMDIFFSIGSDADMAQVNVQNLANQAFAQLPESVQKQGLYIKKQTPNILLAIALTSPSGRYDSIFTSNYASINVVNELDLIPGISNISIIGQRNYSMRIWLRPDLMAELGISTQEVINAIEQQNKDFGIGELGQAPNVIPVPLTVPMATKGRLSTPEEFKNIVIRADLDGAMVLLKDIADVKLGAQDYSVNGGLSGKTTTLLAIYLQYGSNALEVAQQIKDTMKRISKNFPLGLEYSIPYDTTLFVSSSITEVVKTIFEATVLVIIIVFIFLQQFRATLIPVLALIVSIVGTFGGLYILGYSINTLTLFGMVLAIGIVVDDAIVVVENVERNLRTFDLPPKEAARKAMDEVTGPIIAIVFVLGAVFIPVAFLGGIVGQLYKQFAITIAISVFLSGLVALTLSPAIASIILKPHPKLPKLGIWFNKGLEKVISWYLWIASWLIDHIKIGLTLFVLLVGGVVLFFKVTPTSFVPNEDQGVLITLSALPDAASLNRNQKVTDEIVKIAMKHPGVEDVVSLTGFSLLESLDRTTMSTNFINLKNWKYRKPKKLHASQIQKDLMKAFYVIEDAEVIVLNFPAIQGLGTVGGFEFWIENRGDGGNEALEGAVKALIEKAKEQPALSPLQTTAQFNNLQFYVDLDRYKATALGVSTADVFQALQTFLGSVYVNNFNKFGRVYQVIVQAEPKYRENLESLGNIYVRSKYDKMVPLKSLVTISPSKGPNLISRFNDFPAAEIIGGPAAGYSSGQAIAAMEKLAEEVLPKDMAFGWSGAAYQEIATGGKSFIVLICGIFMVFLILSALYESWSLPLAIVLAVPFGILGAFIAIWIQSMPSDVYFQIGLVTLIALTAKNAILIVEFAIQEVKGGMSIKEAALEAARLRFRAIIMTSLTFIFGVMPLVFSSGAGAASRHSVGIGVLGGMISGTLLTLCFIPLFFTFILGLKQRFGKEREK